MGAETSIGMKTKIVVIFHFGDTTGHRTRTGLTFAANTPRRRRHVIPSSASKDRRRTRSRRPDSRQAYSQRTQRDRPESHGADLLFENKRAHDGSFVDWFVLAAEKHLALAEQRELKVTLSVRLTKNDVRSIALRQRDHVPVFIVSAAGQITQQASDDGLRCGKFIIFLEGIASHGGATRAPSAQIRPPRHSLSVAHTSGSGTRFHLAEQHTSAHRHNLHRLRMDHNAMVDCFDDKHGR